MKRGKAHQGMTILDELFLVVSESSDFLNGWAFCCLPLPFKKSGMTHVSL
jgi:hypothetical protein